MEKLEQKDFEQSMANFLQAYPNTTEEDILEIYRKAQMDAILAGVEDYKPLEVESRATLGEDFEYKSKRIDREVYQDEATDDFEGFE